MEGWTDGRNVHKNVVRPSVCGVLARRWKGVWTVGHGQGRQVTVAGHREGKGTSSVHFPGIWLGAPPQE